MFIRGNDFHLIDEAIREQLRRPNILPMSIGIIDDVRRDVILNILRRFEDRSDINGALLRAHISPDREFSFRRLIAEESNYIGNYNPINFFYSVERARRLTYTDLKRIKNEQSKSAMIFLLSFMVMAVNFLFLPMTGLTVGLTAIIMTVQLIAVLLKTKRVSRINMALERLEEKL